jgi:GH24 family phage-related lysozyme (muramidase)
MKIIITEEQYKLLLTESVVNDYELRKTIKNFESTVVDSTGKHYVFDDKDRKTPKTFVNSPSKKKGGTLTIGWGHTGEFAKIGKKISNAKAEELLTNDIRNEENKTKKLFPKYGNYPLYVQRALVNAVYRGEGKSSYGWVKAINSGDWETASKKYLEGWNIDFSKAKDPRYKGGVADRMVKNQEAFKKYAQELKKTKNNSKSNYDDYARLGDVLEMNLPPNTKLKVHKYKTSDGKYRLEVGPYLPAPKGGEGKYLVFFRDGKIKWYDGFKFSNFAGRWDTQLIFTEVKGKKGLIDYEDAINQPYANFAD